MSSQMPALETKGYLRSLFDFSFSSFIAGRGHQDPLHPDHDHFIRLLRSGSSLGW